MHVYVGFSSCEATNVHIQCSTKDLATGALATVGSSHVFSLSSRLRRLASSVWELSCGVLISNDSAMDAAPARSISLASTIQDIYEHGVSHDLFTLCNETIVVQILDAKHKCE